MDKKPSSLEIVDSQHKEMITYQVRFDLWPLQQVQSGWSDLVIVMLV